MASLNQLNCIGNIGRDAETRQAGASPVTSFSLAITSGWGAKKQTHWANVSIWGERGAKVAQYLTKGKPVHVTGEISLREWTNKDGVVKTSLEINASNVVLLGSRDDGDSAAPVAKKVLDTFGGSREAGADDDSPF